VEQKPHFTYFHEQINIYGSRLQTSPAIVYIRDEVTSAD